ncbi:MAG TPA: DUF1761 domain-containing protein [Gemmatimonadales bacterium]|jgi:hypothetical protein|nr:DUF1761 domain-containing protein [Gemmatimonadales bacterium]
MHEHNWLAISVAAVAAFLIGGLWYSPILFAKQWMVANLIHEDQVAAMKAAAPRAYGVSVVCFFVMAFVMEMFINHLGQTTLNGGVFVAFHCWLGFAATIGLTANMYSNKPIRAYFIDAGYQLVYMTAMGAILGAWR